MAQQTMYPAIANSPGTELSAALTAIASTISVTDGTKLPAAPNLLTIGNDESSETVMYTGKTSNTLTGCTRGFDGTVAKAWAAGSKVARYYTAYDHEAFRKNITDLSGVTNESTTDIVLSAGQQILNATKNARLQGFKSQGRTLIDLLGGGGSGESLTGWANNAGNTVVVSTTQKRSGSSSIKPSPDASKGSYISRDFPTPLDPTKQYVLVGWVYVESYTSGTQEVSLRDVGTFTNRYSVYFGAPQTLGSWQPFFVKIPTNNTLVGSGFRLLIGAGAAQVNTMYFDEIRLYAVSAADYAAIGTTITGAAIDALLPYVPPGINGVDGLWVRRYGRNLLPSVPDVLHASAKMNGPYDMTLVAPTSGQTSYFMIPVKGGTQYRFTIELSGGNTVRCNVNRTAGGSGQYASLMTSEGTNTVTFTTDTDATIVYVNMYCTAAGTYTFKNWQLELGSLATPFQPREDNLIAFGGVELHANPNDGSDPDVLREVNGRYEVTRLWRKMALDGAMAWEHHSNTAGYKVVRIAKYQASFFGDGQLIGFVTKFDGKSLVNHRLNVTTSGPDSFRQLISDAYLYLNVSSADSGWGDSYTPSSAEIQAYFNGWKMYNSDTSLLINARANGVYNGTGTKAWVSLSGDVVGTGTSTAIPPMGYMPYQLLYRLATVTTETVQEDGALSLLEGDNFIEVGSGCVSRERANPVLNASGDVYTINTANGTSDGVSALKFKVGSIRTVYRDGRIDNAWTLDNTYSAYGAVRAIIAKGNYDPAASYSVSYIKLDKSPVPSVTGMYAATEKAQLHDLTDGVTEALARVSVVEAKKADKDAPAWITPTLLNGWVNHEEGYGGAKYYKDDSGRVYFTGLIKGGTAGVGSYAFYLLKDYAPELGLIFIVQSAQSYGRITIGASGRVEVSLGATDWVSLSGISFKVK